MNSTLGVPTVVYTPFAYFNLLSSVIAVLFGCTGLLIKRIKDVDEKEILVSESNIEKIHINKP